MASRVLLVTSVLSLDARPLQSSWLHSEVVLRYVLLQPPHDQVTLEDASVSRYILIVVVTVAGQRWRGSSGLPSTIWWAWPSTQQKTLSSSFCTEKREVKFVQLFRDLMSGRRLLQSLLFLGSRAGLNATGVPNWDAFVKLLYRKERGKNCSIISRFDIREEVATEFIISRFEGGSDCHWCT